MSNEGKRIKAHYTGTLTDGEKFDSSYDRGEPIEFVCMQGQMIPGFDKAVKDMKVGEKITVTIPCAEAYGEVREKLIVNFPRKDMPITEHYVVGDKVPMLGPGERPFLATIREFQEDFVVLDMNHHLAGHDLVFEIELISAE